MKVCPVDGTEGQACTGATAGVVTGPGVVIEDHRHPATLAGGSQIAQERIYVARDGDPNVLVLAFAKGDVIPAARAAELGIRDGRLVAPDMSDTAPTEKARRKARVQDKARRRAPADKEIL